MSKQKNSYPLILWVVWNQLLNNFQAFSDFFAWGRCWWCDLSFHLPPRPWPASPSSWHARSRHRSLRSRRRRPKPKQPAEVWRWAGLGRVGQGGLGGLGGLGWVGWPLGVGSLFFPWNHGALSRTSPTVLVCMSFSLCVCVWVLIFRFLISGTCGWTYTVDQLDSPATWLSEFLQYINNS